MESTVSHVVSGTSDSKNWNERERSKGNVNKQQN